MLPEEEKVRHPIWKKEDFFQFIGGERIDMDPAVVQLPEKPSPVVWNFNWDSVNNGSAMASDFRLEDGEITAEIEWRAEHMNDDMIEELGIRFGGYYTGVEKRGNTVTKCELKGVSLMFLHNTPGWKAVP